MAVAKIAITIEKDVLSEVDRLVRRHVFPNRSRAIQQAVGEKVRRLRSTGSPANARSSIPRSSRR